MNVVRLSDRTPLAEWPEFVPWVSQMMLARPHERADADELSAQLRAAIRILGGERYRPIAQRRDATKMTAVHLVALLVTAALNAGEPVDMILMVLTDHERDAVLDLFGDLNEQLLLESGEQTSDARLPVAVEPLSMGLAAASPVAMSQEPGRHRFTVSLAESENAVVEVRLGGGPAGLRQLSGPRLALVEDGVPLPSNDVVAVAVENGIDLASWLEVALCRSGEDED